MTKRIFRSILLVSVIVFLLGLACILAALYSYFSRQLEQELKSEAHYLSLAVMHGGAEALNDLSSVNSRITLVGVDGEVLYDSRTQADTLGSHADREEIQEALQSGSGSAVRYSSTLGEKTVYYAVRLPDNSVLRVSSTQYTIFSILFALIQPLCAVLLVMLILSALCASRASKKIIAPLNHLDLEHPEKNEPYEEIVPLLTHISRQQKTIRQQLRDAQQQQEEFSLITEHMSEGLLVVDGQTRLLSYNSSALHLLGAAEAQTGRSVFALNRSQAFCQAVEKALEGQHNDRTLSLNERICRISANPVIQDGKAVGAVLLVVDETEKNQREALRREFTANVSHELKTPLTSISGFAEILRDGLVKPEDMSKFAGRIFDEAQRLIVLVEDIIKISQLDEGAIQYEKTPVDLSELIQEILHRLSPAAQRAGVELYQEGVSCSLTTVRPILEEVLYNLCDNAIKYNRQGGRVTVSISDNEDGVSIAVEDTGIGIPAAHLNRVFERFYRVDKSHSREIGGTGLGLSIVKHGVAFLGAAVHVDSTPDVGTVFTVRFPHIPVLPE